MVYLISFNPADGESDVFEYQDADLDQAMQHRLRLEVQTLKQRESREVVVFSARNRDDLRATHARYFGDSGLKDNIASLLGKAAS
jgi:hypothetical protein